VVSQAPRKVKNFATRELLISSSSLSSSSSLIHLHQHHHPHPHHPLLNSIVIISFTLVIFIAFRPHHDQSYQLPLGACSCRQQSLLDDYSHRLAPGRASEYPACGRTRACELAKNHRASQKPMSGTQNELQLGASAQYGVGPSGGRPFFHRVKRGCAVGRPPYRHRVKALGAFESIWSTPSERWWLCGGQGA
jgi:hypothetical protein